MYNPQCPRCTGNNTEFTHSIQMRASDEPETMFFKCTDCRKIFREG